VTSTLAPAVASALVAAAWQGIVLAGLVALCLRLLPELSAALRSIVWLAVLALVVALHFTPAPALSSLTAHPAAFHLPTTWSLALAAVWLALSLTRSALLLHSALHLRGVSQRATPMHPPAEIAALLHTGKRSAQLCLSTEVDRPSVAGFFAPRILLPSALLPRLSADELAQIVLHEMQHLGRRDDWTNLAQKIALALFPLNPALAWIERRLCLERELACDDGVLRVTSAQRAGARKAYATTLANLAEHSLVRRSASLALAAWSRRSELSTRVHRILFRTAAPMNGRRAATATSLIACTVLTAAATLSHAPQLVSFAPAPDVIAAQHTPASLTFAQTAAVTPHATLVEATMPAAKPVTLSARTHRRRPHAPALTEANAVRQPAPFRAIQTLADLDPQPTNPSQATDSATNQPTWIVLTRWEYVSTPPEAHLPRRRPTQPGNAVQNLPASTYAALPMPGGWLILQL
jgi:beta-lactamase regulating signal transducer with metallopeptidase domain